MRHIKLIITERRPLVMLADLETWADRPEYRIANDGRGMCNTGWGHGRPIRIICSLNGIGCNVNHDLLEADNRRHS